MHGAIVGFSSSYEWKWRSHAIYRPSMGELTIADKISSSNSKVEDLPSELACRQTVKNHVPFPAKAPCSAITLIQKFGTCCKYDLSDSNVPRDIFRRLCSRAGGGGLHCWLLSANIWTHQGEAGMPVKVSDTLWSFNHYTRCLCCESNSIKRANSKRTTDKGTFQIWANGAQWQWARCLTCSTTPQDQMSAFFASYFPGLSWVTSGAAHIQDFKPLY